MYGEYAHFCRNVMRCSVDTFPLLPSDCYLVDLDKLIGAATSGYDFIVIVNPNNPTGRHIPASNLKAFLERLPPRTTCWIDEAYIDYIEGEESLEATACETANAIVCKSLSKSLALSGARAGYLVANTGLISTIRKWSPPWLVGLPAQIAAIRALDEPQYYQKCYDATRTLRAALAAAISKLDPLGKVVESVGNWVVWVPTIDQQRLLDHCQLNGLYLRSLPAMCAIRIAVKDHETQERMIAILRESLDVVSRTGSLASSR
ncbi:MAG: Histidinol-phosphate aminotransferase [Fimbriimonadaceae bacterium]|nr:Histidinol-phosphate aminotransferase [Fimbriimonadaceae bacterium]